jgi:hypothetical protein
VTRRARGAAGLALAGLLGLVPGCSYAVGDGADVRSPGAHDQDELRADGSRCEFKGRADREVTESVGTGALQPSIRRVYRVLGEGNDRRRILLCREVDTNFDGIKDVVRRYSERGDPIEELADTDYDGRLDTSVRFSKGKIAQKQVDLNRDDKPEETRYYQDGKLSRVQRDTNGDGKPDVWEIYSAGHLERMGVDVDFDGRVDRWNRDAVKERAQREAEEREAEEREAAAASEKADEEP